MSTLRSMLDWTAFSPKHGPVPRYRQLAEWIAAAVKSGDLAPGTPLPSEAQLADYAGVSVDTVRQALSVLREQGVIVTSQGIGSFVAEE
ncbi:MAG TPA: GntR family transcriptional regulator [Trebonia sp.]